MPKSNLSTFLTSQVNIFSFIRGGSVAWYGSQINGSATTTVALVANVLRAWPFIIGKGFSIDRIQFEVTTLAVGAAVVGIYDTASGTTLYPDTLIVQGTEQDTGSTGAKTDTISATLQSDKLYWLAYNANAAPTARAIVAAAHPRILGNTGAASASVEQLGWTVTRTYNATLPSTFTAGGVVTGGFSPLMLVRAV